MGTRYATPPAGEQIRGMVQDRLAEAVQANGEKVTIEWRGS